MFIEKRLHRGEFDPAGIACSSHFINCYKHANPSGLGIRSLLTKDAGGIICL